MLTSISAHNSLSRWGTGVSVRSIGSSLAVAPSPVRQKQATSYKTCALPAAAAVGCVAVCPLAAASRRRRRRRPCGRSSTCCAVSNQHPKAAWHSASSHNLDAGVAVQELLSRWRASVQPQLEEIDFCGSLLTERCVTHAKGNAPSSSEGEFPPMSTISALWKAWRAGEFGLCPLHEAVERQAIDTSSPALLEAFDLFPDDAEVVYPDWREHLIWERPGKWAKPHEENWKKGVRRGSVASTLRRTARALRRNRHLQEHASLNTMKMKPGFAILFVPQRWASRLDDMALEVERAIEWPAFSEDGEVGSGGATNRSIGFTRTWMAPLIAVLSEGQSLQLGTAFLRCVNHVPKVVFLGARELEEAGAEGFRLQESMMDGLARSVYTEYYRKHGRTNGTVVACRSMCERGPDDVGSVIVFADPAASAELPCKVLGLLDSCYPNAVNSGVVAAACNSAPGHSLFVGGRRGRLRQGGAVCLLLPGAADSAVGLCGCEAFGPMWEVFEADMQPGAASIRTVSDPASTDFDVDGRRRALPAGLAFQAAAMDSAKSDCEDRQEAEGRSLTGQSWWVGAPRVSLRLAREKAPGVGEWALFRNKTVTVDGSLLLEGPGPAAEGVGSTSKRGPMLNRVQGFRTRSDVAALGRLQRAYEMERLVGSDAQQARHGGWKPYATLVFGGGDGPRASIIDESLHGGVCFGSAVLGAPGNSLSEVPTEDSVRDWSQVGPPPRRATLVHRQACALLMLYA